MRMIKVNVDGTDQLVTLREFAALVAAENQMTTEERDTATGLFPGVMVYNSETNKQELLTATGWETMTSAPVVVARDTRKKEEVKKEDAGKDAKDSKDTKK